MSDGQFPADDFKLEGDPGSIRASAAKYSAFGTAATDAAGQVRSLDTTLFVGPEADTYREGLKEDLPPHLDTTGKAFSIVGTALHTFSGDLTTYQTQMRPLAAKAPGLWQAVQNAQTALTHAQNADQTHTQQQQAAKAKLKPGETLPTDNYQSGTGAASSSLSSAQKEWNDCWSAAKKVKSDHSDAVDRCDHQIHIASGMRFHKNPSGWGALWAGFKDFVKDHVAGLAKLSGILKTISAIAGVLSFIPGLNAIAAPIALITGAAALAIDVSIKLATGQGSWTGIIIDGALIALPGIGKLAKLARTEKFVKNGLVIKKENMLLRTKVTITNGKTKFSQILPKGTQVHFPKEGPARVLGKAPSPAGVRRSTRPYAHDGVRVSQSATQNKVAARTVQRLEKAGGKDTRVDQAQVDAYGNKVGGNRPDVQSTLNGHRVHVEYDKPPFTRVDNHVNDIHHNDPNTTIITVPAK